MKKILLLAFVFLSALCFGQGGASSSNYPISFVTQSGAPSGACPGPNVFSIDFNTPNLYYCPKVGGTWTVAGGAGSGTVTSVTGTTNQIGVATGTTTPVISITNPFIFPGEATLAASGTGAASLNIPAGTAPSSPNSGDFYNVGGILEFFDGVHTNFEVTTQAAVTTGHCPQFSGTSGLLVDSGSTNCLAAGSLPTGLPLPGNLLGVYDFNEGSGTSLTDISGNGNNGTLAGGTVCGGSGSTLPTWNTVASGGGVVFTATPNGCITLPAALNTGLTFIIAYNMTGNEPFSGSNIGMQALISEHTVVSSTVISMGLVDEYYTVVGIGPALVHKILGVTWNNAAATAEANGGQGTHVISFVGAATDHIYHDGVENPFYLTGPSANSGNYNPGAANEWQFGGGTFNTSWMTGTIYYAAVYNTALTAAQVHQATQVIDQILTSRGITVPSNGISITSQDQCIIDGDSITNGYAYSLLTATAWWTTALAFQNGFSCWDQSTSGTAMITNLTPNEATGINTLYGNNSQRNFVFIQGGRNDYVLNSATVPATIGSIYKYCQQAHQQGLKCFTGTLLCMSQSTTNLANHNAWLRQHWSEFSDMLIDWGSDPNVGGSTCNTNGAPYWIADNIHPSVYGDDQLKWMFQRGVNAFYGNKDWTSANLYTTGAPAATATTSATDTAALSGSANSTVSYVFSANPFAALGPTGNGLGLRVSCTGFTAAGYNSTIVVLTSNTTTITGYLGSAGLANASIQGTCSTPLQTDADVYIRLGGSAASPNFTLQSACGYSGQDLYIKNENTTSPWVITPYTPVGGSAETIDGATSLTMPVATTGNFPIVRLRAWVTTPTTPVCGWKRIE